MDNEQRAPRTVTTSSKDRSGKLDVASLVLVAILLAAGFVLNLTIGKALAITGIQPEFIISAYCLATLILIPTVPQALVIAVLAATVIQITTSIPGVEYLCDLPAILVMLAFARTVDKRGRASVLPFVGAFLTTTVSGLIFAVVGTFAMGADPATIVLKLPIVFGTALANAIVVQVLYLPLKKAAKR